MPNLDRRSSPGTLMWSFQSIESLIASSLRESKEITLSTVLFTSTKWVRSGHATSRSLRSPGSPRTRKICCVWWRSTSPWPPVQRAKSWISFMRSSSPWSTSTFVSSPSRPALSNIWPNWKSGGMRTVALLCSWQRTRWSGRKSIGWARTSGRGSAPSLQPSWKCSPTTNSCGMMLARVRNWTSSSRRRHPPLRHRPRSELVRPHHPLHQAQPRPRRIAIGVLDKKFNFSRPKQF